MGQKSLDLTPHAPMGGLGLDGQSFEGGEGQLPIRIGALDKGQEAPFESQRTRSLGNEMAQFKIPSVG